jgi:antitoxin component of MazEF toxin-antitoxin module
LALTAERAALVARLQADPSDRAAARELAENVAQAAAEDLEADLTIEIAEIVAEPQIEGWSGTVRDRTGVQIGEGNEAEDTVQVNVLKWASAVLELERELLAEAVRRASLAAELDELEGGRDKSFLSQADAEAEIEGPELSL